MKNPLEYRRELLPERNYMSINVLFVIASTASAQFNFNEGNVIAGHLSIFLAAFFTLALVVSVFTYSRQLTKLRMSEMGDGPDLENDEAEAEAEPSKEGQEA